MLVALLENCEGKKMCGKCVPQIRGRCLRNNIRSQIRRYVDSGLSGTVDEVGMSNKPDEAVGPGRAARK